MSVPLYIDEEVKAVAVQIGKSEDMRISAGQRFAILWKYVTDPSTDSAQQMADKGVPITQKALWAMVVNDPSYPKKLLGHSWATGQRLLAIGKAPDPEAAVDQEREKWRAEKQEQSVTKHLSSEEECNSDGKAAEQADVPPVSQPESVGRALHDEVTHISQPESVELDQEQDPLVDLIFAVKSLDTDDFASFEKWFLGYIGRA